MSIEENGKATVISYTSNLIAKVYEVDPSVCSRCGSQMRILAVITERQEVQKILRHLVKVGRPPPGFDPVSLN